MTMKFFILSFQNEKQRESPHTPSLSFPPPTENFVDVGKEAKQAVWSTADETRVVAL